jgi:phosphatidylglycerol---prolipoprotein diacylglyceryl transferase
MSAHLFFDLTAAAIAGLLVVVCEKVWLKDQPKSPFRAGDGYFLALGFGVMLGSYGLGTLNLWLSGIPAIGRSILGALIGGILAVEIYKRRRGIQGSTGLVLVPAFAALVVIGRIGCALSGLEDNTYGVSSTLPWAQDFGDGILRHPVAAYESVAMALFLAVALVAIIARNQVFLRHGFYLMVGYYALQRFVWEFLKPYETLIGPFNLFHFACVLLVAYAGWMMSRSTDA